MATSQQPPIIPGLTYRGFLGSGGFADVYLYESTSPVRNVAVKVLHDKAVGSRMMDRFVAEANTMAALEHPYIVRVYSSGVTADGRPYIEMAYYSEQTLSQAVKKGPLPVPEVLKIGVQLASAVEAAHSVGLLHRDIKPANVLMDKFGDPALTDFGIASHLHDADDAEASVSVPWAPPEALFSTSSLDRRCDIYSLAATLWHLLTGRSPFEVPGGDNKPKTMMLRVRDYPVPSTGRGDVPQSLELLLKQAMSKDPKLRPATAESFARSLNAIEEELHLRPTPFKVARTGSLSPIAPVPNEDRTRMRTSPVLVPEKTQMRSEPGQDATRVRSSNPEPSTTRARGAASGSDEPRGSKRSKLSLIVALSVVVIVAASVTVWVASLAPKDNPPPELPTPTMDSDDGFGANTYPGPVSIVGKVVNGQAVFTWQYEHSVDSDSYQVLAPGGPTEGVQVPDPSYTLPYNNEEVCIQVKVVRASGGYAQLNWSEQGCAP